MIARYLGLTISHEQALADAFAMVGLRHAVEPEMRNAARLHSNWCHGHLGALRPMVERYGAARAASTASGCVGRSSAVAGREGSASPATSTTS
jgi:hypothetical protein